MSMDIETYYLITDGDDYPPAITRFAPYDRPQRVVFSMHRYGVFDTEEGYCVETCDDEDDARAELAKVLADVGQDEDTEDPRFFIVDAHNYDIVPEWFSDGGFGARWVSTDAWRGYSQVTHNDTWEDYAGGWVTGYPDDTVRHKVVAADLFEALMMGRIEPPFPIVWFFGVTSNVFSTASDMLVPADRSDEFDAWLQSVDFDPEAVGRAFN